MYNLFNRRDLAQKVAYYLPFLGSGNVWEQNYVVEEYKTQSELQKPEQVVLELLKDKAPEMKMLDLGVGAGRTTTFFKPLMKDYVGVDSSKNMVTSCQKRFGKTEKCTFMVGDARNMDCLRMKSLILFCLASTALTLSTMKTASKR